MKSTTIIGQALYEFRVLNRLSQQDIASAIGVSRMTISNWESGRVCPPVKHIEAVSDYFKVTVSEFFKKGEDGTK